MGNSVDQANPGVLPGVIMSKNPANIIAQRAPTSSDRRYKIGTLWIDKANNASYQLTSVVAGSANWELLGSATGAVATITGDSGGALSPSSGNINILGTSADGLAFAGSGSTLTGSISAASTSQRGTLETATDGEAIAASSSVVALTPSNLAALTAANLAALTASDGQAIAESSTDVYLTPSNVSAMKKYSNVTCRQSPLLQSNANTGAAPVGTDTGINIMTLQDDNLEVYNIGTQTIIAPRMEASGLLVSLDLTDDEGCEYNWGARSNAKNVFTVGTDGAFALEWNFTLADVTGADPIGIGFRKVEANNSTLESYTDFAWIGVSESDTTAVVSIKTRLNSGSVTTTDTTDAWADGETHSLKILVSAAGVVTYEIDGSPPTVTAAFTFDADEVMPFFHLLHGATSPGAVHWVNYNCGPQ